VTSAETDLRPAVGVIGLGRMGAPMARRLGDAGFEVRVFDVDPSVAARVALHPRITAVDDGRDTIVPAGALILMLPSSGVVRGVIDHLVTDPAGSIDTLAGGGVVIDMGSSDPGETCRIGEQMAESGVPFIDAPVSGGVAAAEQGTLAVLVGGSSEHLERARPVLAPLAGRVVHVGRLGAGHALKALNNLLSATGLIAAAEALAVGTRFGLDPGVMLDAINASTGRNNSTEKKFPAFVFTRAFNAGFTLDLMVKDLRTAERLAQLTETATPLSALVAELFSAALSELPEGADHTSVVEWVERNTGCRLEPGGNSSNF
jgi:3-hydroxyisobutyrate dehydrogenase